MQQIRDDSGRDLFYYTPSYISNKEIKPEQGWKRFKSKLLGVLIAWLLVALLVSFFVLIAMFPATILLSFLGLLVTSWGVWFGETVLYDGS